MKTQPTKFYKRSGERTSKAKVLASQKAHANSYRIGVGIGGIRRQINHRLADHWASMSLVEYCRESGAFTWK